MRRSPHGPSLFLPTPSSSDSHFSSDPGFTCRSAQPSMQAETPVIVERRDVVSLAICAVPQQDEVAQTPTGYESLWYDTFSGSHAAASEKRRYNSSYTGSKYKTPNRSYSPLTTNKNTEDERQKYPLPRWCRGTGRRFWNRSVQPLPVKTTSS